MILVLLTFFGIASLIGLYGAFQEEGKGMKVYAFIASGIGIIVTITGFISYFTHAF